jgi:TRAP-type C4-dicarboxylate transport system substrate-binding protein
VVNYYTQVPFPAVYFSVSMNKNKWNGLPKDVQDAIMSVGGLKGSKFWGKNWFDTAKGAVKERASAAGKTIDLYQLPDAERERWLSISGKPLWSQWVQSMEAKGKKDAQAILDTTLDLLK